MRKLLVLFLIVIVNNAFSQTLSIGSYAEYLARTNQILGLSDDASSFCIRPVNSAFNTGADSALQTMAGSKNLIPRTTLFGSPAVIKALPFTWISDYNSRLPHGYNNGPMYPNVGYQTLITGGFFIKAGILTIQFKPELVHAENAQFLTFADVQANYKSGLIRPFYNMENSIDAPERYGPFGISHLGLGQSKITLTYKHVELGLSTENMWWGPGVQNAIMMSNSAPGFVHWTFNSASPIKTKIGSFEWQLIGGILKQSGYFPYDPGRLVYGNDALYIPIPVVSRYLSAFTANWQPKWIKGLYVGVSAYEYTNRDSLYNNAGAFKKYFNVFGNSSYNTSTNAGQATENQQNSAFSAYVRQVLPKVKSEIYVEYALNNGSNSLTDFLIAPENASAYTLGGTRYFDLKNNRFLQVTFELTHLQLPDTYLVRADQSFYENSTGPRDGYTNQGRYVGAGIGPGGNSLVLDLKYLIKQNSFGLKFERYVHNNDLYYAAFAGTANYASHWVDFAGTFYANLKFKRYLISAEYTPVKDFNYEYLLNNDITNTHASLNLTYYFN